MATEQEQGGYRPASPRPLHRRASRILKGIATSKEKFIPDHSELVRQIETFREMGCVIAFTTGVWDLFHIGHAEYMEHGKAEAQKLYPDAEQVIFVVGIDTDELTRQRKGPKRPIVPEAERAGVIGHLATVDLVTLQYEPNQLYRTIPHDVRIISTSTKDIPPELETDIKAQCAHLVNLPPQAETSTSARIRTLVMDGSLTTLEKFKQGVQRLLEEVTHEMSV